MEQQLSKKPYFFCLTVCSHRTGAHLGKKVGVIFANSQGEAETLAWERHGHDAACELWVEEIPEEGYGCAVYKSEI